MTVPMGSPEAYAAAPFGTGSVDPMTAYGAGSFPMAQSYTTQAPVQINIALGGGYVVAPFANPYDTSYGSTGMSGGLSVPSHLQGLYPGTELNGHVNSMVALNAHLWNQFQRLLPATMNQLVNNFGGGFGMAPYMPYQSPFGGLTPTPATPPVPEPEAPEPPQPSEPEVNQSEEELFSIISTFITAMKNNQISGSSAHLPADPEQQFVMSSLEVFRQEVPTAIYNQLRALTGQYRSAVGALDGVSLLDQLQGLDAAEARDVLRGSILEDQFGLVVDDTGTITEGALAGKTLDELTMADLRDNTAFLPFSTSELEFSHRLADGAIRPFGSNNAVHGTLDAALADDGANPVAVYLLGQSQHALDLKDDVKVFVQQNGGRLPYQLRTHMWAIMTELDRYGEQTYRLAQKA
ncbi:MAG: hypothetical protein KC475_01860 [Cyanobacteria bacterium HKST-UBA03]|nr:hypothetical protein [Cyanobacteria bacterium HKST-UBA03]